ncbi:MAG: hypothetical protein JSU65_04205, partial [Candidatus Zixiibacteriota bacterium]
SSHLELVAEVVAEEAPKVTESGRIQITDSKEVDGEVRETVATAPSTADEDTGGDTETADDVTPTELDEQESSEHGSIDEDVGTGEAPGESIDPELAAALENYKATGAIPIGELAPELQQPETLVGGPSVPKPGEVIETTKRAEDIPEGFVAAPEDQPEGTGQITDRIEQAEQNEASEDNVPVDPDEPTDNREPVTPNEIASSLDDVVKKLDELDKAEKS